MKWGTKEISELSNDDLIDAYNKCQDAFNKRQLASQHEKFNVDKQVNGKTIKRMDFPPINPVFIELENEINYEITKRNLKTGE